MLAAYGEFGSSRWVSGQEPAGIDPYTSSVDTCTKRPTPRRTAASSSVCVPSTLVRTKSPPPAMERSTCDSAAKCTTAPAPAMAASTAAGSQMSPSTTRSRGSSRQASRLARTPAYVNASSTTTSTGPSLLPDAKGASPRRRCRT